MGGATWRRRLGMAAVILAVAGLLALWSARERERVVLPRDETDVGDWALAGGDVGGGFRREGGGTGDEEFERGVGRGGGGGVRFESRGDDGQGLADDARGERRGGSAGGGSLYNADR